MRRPELHGLYVITDSRLIPPSRMTEFVGAAIRGGARMVQYRDKGSDGRRRRAEAEELKALCGRHGVTFIVNDDIELAAEIGASGVHLGEEDPTLERARARLGPRAIIGVSCYNDLQRARQAETHGADYVAFGALYPSSTKPNARRAPLTLLGEAKRCLGIPVCAIGGIRPRNAGEIVHAGADMLAVIDAVFGAHDVEAAAREIAQAIEKARASKDDEV